jgi:hypothetical protein
MVVRRVQVVAPLGMSRTGESAEMMIHVTPPPVRLHGDRFHEFLLAIHQLDKPCSR